MKIFSVIFFGFLGAFSFSAFAEKVEISVTQAEISILKGQPVFLDEVITATNLTPDERDVIGQQVLMTEGEDADYESGDLLRRIRLAISHAGNFETRDIQYSSPEQVHFVTRADVIPQNQVSYRMITAVMGICRSCRIHSVDIRFPKTIPGNWKTYDAKYALSRVQKSNLLPVDLLDDQGTRAARIYLQVDLGIEKRALVASRSINRGDSISDHNVRSEWKVWDGFSRLVDPADGVVGKIANQNFTEGSILLETQLTKERLVSFGDPIKIIYIANSFEISSQGISMENGGQGDMVRIKTNDQKKDLVGLVTERGVVQIQ